MASRLTGIIILSFLFLFIPFYPVQWIALFLLFVVLTSFLYSRILKKSIFVSRRLLEIKTYRYQEAVSELVVVNRSFFPIPALSVIDSCGGLYTNDSERFLLSLKRRERRYCRYHLKSIHRGEFPLGPVRIRTSDPLGLFSFEKEFPLPGSVVVYPRVYLLRQPEYAGLPAGPVRVANPIYEDLTRYRSVREYVPGDEFKKINWKASAKTGSLHTTEYLPSIYYPALIVLNLTSSDYPHQRVFHFTERAIEIAASLAEASVKKGQETGLLATGETAGGKGPFYLPIRSGESYGTALLSTLARIRPSDDKYNCIDLLFTQVKLSTGMRIMYVGPPLTEERLRLIVGRPRANISFELYYLGWTAAHRGTAPPGISRVYLLPEEGEPVFD